MPLIAEKASDFVNITHSVFLPETFRKKVDMDEFSGVFETWPDQIIRVTAAKTSV